MTHLYQVYGTRLWYQDKEVRSFTTPKKTDRNLNFYLGGGVGWGAKDELCQPSYLFQL